MLNRAAEESFEKGAKALSRGEWREATAFFEGALTLEKQHSPGKPQARYRSYYGLCLGMAKKQHEQAIKFCKAAVQIERYNPDLHWNLGRVLMNAGRKREAYRVFVRGVNQEPGHRGLATDIRRMGLRKRPVLPFLSRTNRLNVVLGRMRSQSGAKNQLSTRHTVRRVS